MAILETVLVCVSGGFGAVIRYCMEKCLSNKKRATLFANLLSCSIVGFVMALSQKVIYDSMMTVILSGFCGGFSTLSAYALQSVFLTSGKSKTVKYFMLTSFAPLIACVVVYFVCSNIF